jgi:hypothetical protein
VSTTTSSFSTSFAWLQWGRGVDGITPSVRLSACNRRQVVQWPFGNCYSLRSEISVGNFVLA